jgi:hypothetical protein
MLFRLFLIFPIVFTVCSSVPAASAVGTVRLELVGDPRETAMILQDWARTLDQAGIANVRLRTGAGDIKPRIETQGSAERPLYVVTGRVLSRQELLLPGEKFKRSDLARLKKWLDDLAAQGPPDQRPVKGVFGLTKPQFESVEEDLARPLGFTTKGASRREVVEKIARQLANPLWMDPETARDLQQEKVEEEFNGLSCGTVLACVVRAAGYCLVPQADGAGIKYTVVKARPDLSEVWPVGGPPAKRHAEIPSALYEMHNVNIQNYAAASAVEAVADRLKLPFFYDRKALARYGIDPAKALVTVPQSRSSYSTALRKLLSQAGLKFEIRCDEGGKLFLWITTIKPA